MPGSRSSLRSQARTCRPPRGKQEGMRLLMLMLLLAVVSQRPQAALSLTLQLPHKGHPAA